MDLLQSFHVRPLAEADIREVIEAIGGAVAHPDAASRSERGADFLLDGAIIELKSLDEEGIEKPERQQKLAALFRKHAAQRPVVVLDRSSLSDEDQRRYDRIVEGPVKGAVASARKQLKQSRSEFPEASCSILFVLNNGYTTLDHDSLTQLVAQRARNDSREIDGVVVAGCYFYSDGWDSFFLWPLKYVPINLDRPFKGHDKLRDGFHRLANRYMTDLMQGRLGSDLGKGPVIDTAFDVEGVTFVKPAPPMGRQSDFYGPHRPRKDSTGLEACPPVATTFPSMARHSWRLFREALPHDPELRETYEGWRRYQAEAAASGEPLKPFVPVPVTLPGWQAWREAQGHPPGMWSVRQYANDLFNTKVHEILDAAREGGPNAILPPRYVLAVTEEIGQDKAHDVSRIAEVRERAGESPAVRPLAENLRIFHEHALALGAAYAVAQGLNYVMWRKDLRYAWG